MSFILDALKKLEQKRLHGSVPDLMTVHAPETPGQKSRTLWPYLLVAALVLNAAILTAVFHPWESDEQLVVAQSLPDNQEEKPSSEPEPSVSPAPAAQVSDTSIIKEEKNSSSSETTDGETGGRADSPAPESGAVVNGRESTDIPVQDEEVAESETPEENTILIKHIPEEDAPASLEINLSDEELDTLRNKIKEEQARAGDSKPASEEPEEESEPDSVDNIIEFSQLPSEIKSELPDISISGHIYSNDPRSRLANINGNILREGEKVTRDLKVDEITMSAVIFSYQSFRFRVRAF